MGDGEEGNERIINLELRAETGARPVMDIVIRNGRVVTPGGIFEGDVGVVEERIAALGEGLRGNAEFDATGCYVLPGAIDPHVHLQMWAGGYRSSDDFASGTIAAACGGTTTVIDFVEPADAEPLLSALAARRSEADGRVAIDYGLHMTIDAWHAARPEELASLSAVVAAGVPSFKIYQAYGRLRLDDVLLHRALRAVVLVGGLPIVHSENGPLCEELRAEALAHGHITPRYQALTRPTRQEAEAVNRVIDIAALAGSSLYIVHVSCAEAVARASSAHRLFGATLTRERYGLRWPVVLSTCWPPIIVLSLLMRRPDTSTSRPFREDCLLWKRA